MLSKDVFKNPPSRYRPLPFWFWNSKLRIHEIEAQIRDFHAKGLGGFFIHARFGLETEYLSREWMDCVKHAVKIAEELGMEVWLYDENGFPSGIGDLKVSRVREYRAKFIDLTEREVSSGETVRIDLPVGEVLMAYAHPRSKPHDQGIDLTDCVSGNQLVWTPPRGEWSVVVYSKCTLEDPNDIVYGVDYLNPEAMRFFFDYTFDPYVKAIGEHFGKTIRGIFTDEPTLLPWHHNGSWYQQRDHARVVVWNDLIEQEMTSRMGMSARDFLPHLFFDVDDATPDVRRAFWQSVEDLYLKAFFNPYRGWCDQHNLQFVGHALLEEGLYLNTDFQADITASLATMHIPGVDHLAQITEIPYGGGNLPMQLTNMQGEKLIASLGHWAGKETVLSETYGCAGWELTLEKMKWIADWQYSLGINMLCPHAMFYSIEGFRKTDAPPSENHEPWWKYYRQFADYIGRLSYVMREGRHVAKVALFYPLKDFWGRHTVGKEFEKDRVVSDSFDLCASILPRLHYDYDILPEQALASAEINEGRIVIGSEEFEVLIAPISITESAAGDKVREFVQAGGTWILPPMTRKDPEGDHLRKQAEMLSGAGKVIPVLAGTLDRDMVTYALDNALREAIKPDVKIASPSGKLLTDVRYVHREVDGKHVYFIINTSDQSAKSVISMEIMGSVEEWNLETGDIAPASNVERRDNRLCTQRELPPYGSALFVVDPQLEAQFNPARDIPRTELLVLPDEWRFDTEEPNALILNKMNVEIVTRGDGTVYTYTANFHCDHIPEKLMLMLDDVEYRWALMGRMRMAVHVNETTWDAPEFGSYLDNGFKTLDISSAVTPGENTLKVVITHSPWSGQPLVLNSAPVLFGRFACNVGSCTIMAPAEAAQSGSWTEFGYPHFSGTAVYTHGFKLPRETRGRRIIVSVDCVGDMVEILVNGKSADVRLWQPWEADITDMVTRGRNTLSLRITNSMANFIDAQPKASGLLGPVRIMAEEF
ncbi:MAG: glycosyl hydrolase [Armatimonadota bacterium]